MKSPRIGVFISENGVEEIELYGTEETEGITLLQKWLPRLFDTAPTNTRKDISPEMPTQ